MTASVSWGQIVTAKDLLPSGWACEGCGTAFVVGAQAFGVLTGVMPNGDMIEGDYRCEACWRAAQCQQPQ